MTYLWISRIIFWSLVIFILTASFIWLRHIDKLDRQQLSDNKSKPYPWHKCVACESAYEIEILRIENDRLAESLENSMRLLAKKTIEARHE